MIPNVPVISLLVGVQVVNGLLLPINLFFIWRLSRSASVMGERRSSTLLDSTAGVTVLVTSCLSIVLVLVTVAGL
jgi:Mn2+/Fe2+ NRAMP family transporter